MTTRKQLLHEAAKAKAALLDKLSELADARMALYVAEFRRKHKGKQLRILFGNGSESFVDVNGEPALFGWRGRELAQALQDVWDITDGYRFGCPNDVEIK